MVETAPAILLRFAKRQIVAAVTSRDDVNHSTVCPVLLAAPACDCIANSAPIHMSV
jgi:hypothetical protein